MPLDFSHRAQSAQPADYSARTRAAPQPPARSGAPRSLSDLITGKRSVSTPEDMVRGGWSGFASGLRGLASMGAFMNPAGYMQMKQQDAALERARAQHPRAVEVLKPSYQPQTTAGKYTRTVAEFLPNAALGGEGLLVRGAGVVIPALLSETAGQATSGSKYEGVARLAGALVGGGLSGVRAGPRPVSALSRVERTAVRKLNAQARQDPHLMVQNARERARNGINPALVDVTDEAGRGVIRAAASRMTPARTAVQSFADQRAVNLPRRLSAQARRHLSDDPRTPREIATDLANNRATQARAQYGAARDAEVQMTPEAVEALRTGHGQSAITEAIAGERNPEVRAALNRLRDDIHDNPSTPITVGMADGISRALLGRARETTNPNLSGILTGLGTDVRNAARRQVPEYGAAVDNYAAESRLMGAADRGESYLNPRTTDEFVEALDGTGADGLALARATARRNVEVASGENVAAAPGVARRIATAPEVQARTRAMLPEDKAQAFERAVHLENEAVQDARYVAPNTGSPTQGRGQDALQMAGEGAAMVAQAGGQHWAGAAMTAAKLWLRRQGLNNREAEALASMAIDDTRTAHVAQYLQQRLGPGPAQQFMQSLPRQAPLLLTSGALASGSTQ
jgi:hypothetical protein